MVNVKIFHNPRCSKSRQTNTMLEEQGITADVIEYLKTPPSAQEIKQLLKLLNMQPRDLMRKNEAEYKALNLADDSLTNEQLIQAMHENPKLIERPIVVVDEKRAAIGRPPENVLNLFK